METKRLFFGMEVAAPWPEEWPSGRILLDSDRHLTLSFLGDQNLPSLLERMNDFPEIGFTVGLAGMFDRPIFLPHRHPQTAGWHIHFLEEEERFLDFQRRLVLWLKESGVQMKERNGKFLSHVTIARPPFVIHEWKQAFIKLPLYLKNIHLMSSLGMSKYEICWTHEILAPFVAREHTADMAFLVRGESFDQLYLHASLALAFDFLPLIRYVAPQKIGSFDEMIMQLNELVARVDAEEGCPFKAVSFHSEMQIERQVMEWEMIVDV
jgi:RNA 2',3'-cyclic 3'-phosphodiesterase